MKSKNLLISIIFIFFSIVTYGQSSKKDFLKELDKMPVSAVKEITVSEDLIFEYDIRAIKNKKDWLILMADTIDVFLMTYNEKEGVLRTESEFSAEATMRTLVSSKYKIKSKSKEIDDLKIQRYYKLKGKTLKIISSNINASNLLNKKNLKYLKLFKK